LAIKNNGYVESNAMSLVAAQLEDSGGLDPALNFANSLSSKTISSPIYDVFIIFMYNYETEEMCYVIFYKTTPAVVLH